MPTTKKHLTAGIDAGSSSVKVAICRSEAGDKPEVLATAVQRIRRRNIVEVVEATFAAACQQAGVDPKNFDYVASTGDGEMVEMRTGHFYSMTAHARGARCWMWARCTRGRSRSTSAARCSATA